MFQSRALTLYQRGATLKIGRQILFHFQIIEITVIHNIETMLTRH